MPQLTINDVINELDIIISDSVRDKNYLAIFAWVYKRTTEQIKAEVDKGSFGDGQRLQQFDIVFASLYLDAYRDYKDNKPISQSWKIAFDAAMEKHTIIQHLMMGMNAHINLDLAVAASTVMEGKPIAELEHDFNKVNDVLAGLLDEMQVKMGKVSKLMFLLDWIGKRTDEKVINFSMEKARTVSWFTANELWNLTGESRTAKIKEVDRNVKSISEFLIQPPSRFLRIVLKLIGRFEEKNVQIVIRKFKQ